MGGRRVVIVGGGAAGSLTAVQLLRLGGPDLHVMVVEPRGMLGQGVAFATPDPWHRLNVPAITMSGLPEDPDHFRAFLGCAPDAFPPRQQFGAYLGTLLDAARETSAASLSHVRARATRVRDGAPGAAAPLLVDLAAGEALLADAVVIATGNQLPRVPDALVPLAETGDARCIADPWAPGALEEVPAGASVAIIGTGHTAIDLAASLIRGTGVTRVIALSRNGEIPRSHDDPWQPRPSRPAFTAEEFGAFPDPIAEVRARYAGYPGGWRQALDSVRPIHRELWLAMDEPTRRRFLGLRREWEIHRSRLAPGVERDLRSWQAEGRLELRAGQVRVAESRQTGIRILTDQGSLDVGRVLVATGPDEAPAATPFLAATMAAGLARPGPLDLGIDVHPYDFRVRDATGGERRALFALGPVIRGSVWECIAIPEIRLEALRIAEQVVAA